MPAISFRPRFEDPIVELRKTHTIRRNLARGFHIGHWMPLYIDQRTRHCRLMGSGRANRTYEVRLDFDAQRIETDLGEWTRDWDLNNFARSDGFQTWPDMEQFWRVEHPGVRQFGGVLMGWETFVRGEHRLGEINV